jgi:hypothetical protein
VVLHCAAYSYALKKEAVGSAETLASSCKTTQLRISEGSKRFAESRKTVGIIWPVFALL